ncbi:MAG: dihydropteroate synthase [Verrucomicrobia bacterium]|nr:dihydropteroate synthase [Verrucomicrobiota bacterium]
MIWKCRGRTLDLTRTARVMGILNTTPDSFSDGGLHAGPESALAHARAMIAEGADIIDIGGESTRPGAPAVSTDEEMDRVIPVTAALRKIWDGFISIDTTKAAVARAALAAGADIVNDVSGLRHDPAMPDVCRESGCGVVVMHMAGTPQTMQANPCYRNVVAEVAAFFRERMETLSNIGLDPECLCFDPGIGFGKTQEHNLALLAALSTLAPDGRPLLLGVSRKSFIGRLLALEIPADRDGATAILTAMARRDGVMLHRVHAVRENLRALRLAEAVIPKSGVQRG